MMMMMMMMMITLSQQKTAKISVAAFLLEFPLLPYVEKTFRV